jgi:hypothetical protein
VVQIHLASQNEHKPLRTGAAFSFLIFDAKNAKDGRSKDASFSALVSVQFYVEHGPRLGASRLARKMGFFHFLGVMTPKK